MFILSYIFLYIELLLNNDNHNIGVEKTFKKLLIEKGFREKEKISKGNSEITIYDDYLEVGEFDYQPCGTQNYPDFLINISNDSKYIKHECKSSDGNKPKYNSGSIKHNIIYTFSNKKKNISTFYFGHDIITPEHLELIKKLDLEVKKVTEEYNKNLNIINKNLGDNNRGIQMYYRSDTLNVGDEGNYFTHPKREICENNVIKYLGFIRPENINIIKKLQQNIRNKLENR